MTEVMVLYGDRELTGAQQVGIRLSHNAIAGQDGVPNRSASRLGGPRPGDPAELYDEINDVGLKEYSGLDDRVLGQLNPPSLDPLSEKGLEYRIVSVAFLRDEVERAEKLFAKVLEQRTGDATWVNHYADYNRFLDALTAAKASAGVKNTAPTFRLLLDVLETSLSRPSSPDIQCSLILRGQG